MQEIELKFLVPQSRLKGLMRQADVKSSETTQMAAHYYDTPKQELAQAGIGLRIRKEGNNWVQTIKAGGDGIAARLEHNTLLDNEHVQVMLDAGTLMPDLSLYKDTAIEPALADFKLKKLAKKLTRQYVTDVQRITRLLKEGDSSESNSSIEIAYDYGQVINGNDDSQQQLIQEIEFELISGEVDYLFEVAKTWCKRYKLCLSTVTKAERGGLLIKGKNYSPAVSANLNLLNVNKDSSMPAFIRAAVHNCLLQMLPNSSAIVAGSDNNKHALQLYLGIQRLYSALDTFKDFSDQINPEWQPLLKQTAEFLENYLELAHLVTDIEPKLVQQGAPTLDWQTDLEKIKVKPIDSVSANDFQLTLLELIQFTMSDCNDESQLDKLAIDKLAKILAKNYSKLFNSDDNPADLNPDAQDKVRHHLKNLRTISEFSAPLYSKKKSKRWLKQVIKAQKSLENHIENTQYQQRYQQKSTKNPNALYGAGWLAATLNHNRKRCKKRLSRLQDTATFW